MTFFRRANIKTFFTLITGIVFLNLSFFLTELSYMGLETKNKKELVNLVRMLSGISEEETEVPTDGAHESQTIHKTVDLFHHYSYSQQYAPFSLTPGHHWNDLESCPLSGALDSILQPPERA
jgi:hypothetical protein